MSKNLFTFFTIAFLLLNAGSNVARGQDTLASADKSLAGQYSEIIQKSKNNPQGFKIVNPERLSKFNKSFTDSLRQTRNRLTEVQKRLASQTKAINDLKAELASKDKSLTESRSMVDGISILGIVVSKATYHWIMWGLVVFLAAVLAFILFRSGAYKREARYRTKLFSELSDEFQQFKTKSNDKEKKLARELQTEKNRVDELLKR